MTKLWLILMLSAIVAATACTPEGKDPSTEPAAQTGRADQDASPPVEKASDSELAGTAWRLLNITSMDDTVDVPGDPSKYTLSFSAEGAVSMQADCNRGTGSWTSESSGQLQFGPVAATRALCPPGSLSEKYLAQFEWVRSYVLRESHLFLATMADGAIIEFEPLPEVAATVLGEEVRSTNPSIVRDTVLTRLFDRYAAERGLNAEESEIETWLEAMDRGMAAEGLGSTDDLKPDEVVELQAMRREMGRAIIRQWKINRSLHETYGGRIIYQQMGPEPLDAYRKYLEERQATGDFQILDPSMNDVFWRYFTEDSMHQFMAAGSDDEIAAFSMPPWKPPAH